MSSDAPERFSELRELLAALNDGKLTGEQGARIDQLVVEDVAARRFYLQMMFLYGQLRWKHRREEVDSGQWIVDSEEATEDGVTSGQWLVASEANPRSEIINHQSEILSPFPVSPSSIRYPLPTIHYPLSATHPFVGGVLFSYLTAALIVGVGMLIGWAWKLPNNPQIAGQPSPPAVERQPKAEPRMAFVGRITGMVDCQSVQSPESRVQSPESGSRLSSLVSLGDTFALASGLMEITYDTGARVLLQGPVTYEVESAAGGFLSVGKLTARVEQSRKYGVRSTEEVVSGQWSVASRNPSPSTSNPQSPIPNPSLSTIHYPLFTVRTPTATVTDLGTEFGVEVNDQGVTGAEVFVGRVKVAVVGRQTGGDAEQRILQAGEAAHVEGRKVRMVTTGTLAEGEKRFVRVMPSREQTAATYPKLVLSLQPVVYYRMEKPDSETRHLLLDSALGNHHAEMHFADDFGLPWERGLVGEAVYFHGPGVGDCAIVPDYPKATGDQLTVAVWIMAATRSPSLVWSVIAANWGDNVHGQLCFGTNATDGDLAVAITQRDGQQIVVREGPSHPLPLARWQHVAFVVDKSVIRLYRNGVEVASEPCVGLLAEPPLRSLVIGNKGDDTGLQPIDSYRCDWHGRIDELAVFNRALSAMDIQLLCDAPVASQHTSPATSRPAGKGTTPKEDNSGKQ